MEKEQLKVFSERLTKLRQKKELTQQQLGEVLQIPRVSITRYETAERTPTVDHLVQFAQFFNVPSDYLLGLSPVESYDTELQAVCDYIGLSEEAVVELNLIFDSAHQPEALDLEESEYVTELLDILSWLISERHIYEIIYHFLWVKTYSQKYVLLYEDMCTNGFFKINHKNEKSQGIKKNIDMKLIDLFKLQEIEEDIDEELDNISKLQEIEKDIDFERYRLNKYTEKLLNYFDQREQVRDNGEHNPPKE